MIAMVMPVFNRIEYAKRCFESLKNMTTIPGVLVIIDDFSTDMEVLTLYNSTLLNCAINIIRMQRNGGVRNALLCGIDRAFELDCDIIINLDSDAIVKADFIEKLISLRNQHPGHIVSGFNAISAVNPIIETYDNCCVKGYANGINMCFDKVQYEKYIRPSLLKEGNWDYNTSLACREDNLPFYVTKPSVVQHIGLVSSMGHTQGGAKADEAYDF